MSNNLMLDTQDVYNEKCNDTYYFYSVPEIYALMSKAVCKYSVDKKKAGDVQDVKQGGSAKFNIYDCPTNAVWDIQDVQQCGSTKFRMLKIYLPHQCNMEHPVCYGMSRTSNRKRCVSVDVTNEQGDI